MTRPEPRAAAFALAVVLASATIWTALPAALLSAPHGDNVEQLNWSHALQWGYFKHPPLPTWLLHAAIAVFGPSATLTYALAMACVAVALLLLWRCAYEVMDPGRALVALLVSSADYYLMGRGSFLNHNTVMLPFVALSAWAVLRIARGAGWQAWLVLGLAQALGLLTKYQMALVLCANGAALLAAGAHRQPRFAAHLALASAATLLPLIPHALWVADHGFSTFEYAGHSLLADLPPGPRTVACASFLAQQLARLAPALLALALAHGLARARPHDSGATQTVQAGTAAARAGDREAQRALTMLALVPLAGIVLLVLIVGVAPQNHWGASSTLLIPLLLVSRVRPGAQIPVRTALAATVLCHAGAIAWNVTAARIDPGPHHRFAARTLAALAQRRWSQHETGPIRIVLGPDWEAGSIALYLPDHPAVLPNGDWRQAPWIDRDTLRRCGALVVARIGSPLHQQLPPTLADSATDLAVLTAPGPHGGDSSVQAALIAPETGSYCP